MSKELTKEILFFGEVLSEGEIIDDTISIPQTAYILTDKEPTIKFIQKDGYTIPVKVDGKKHTELV
jgi:hypothetical protein